MWSIESYLGALWDKVHKDGPTRLVEAKRIKRVKKIYKLTGKKK